MEARVPCRPPAIEYAESNAGGIFACATAVADPAPSWNWLTEFHEGAGWATANARAKIRPASLSAYSIADGRHGTPVSVLQLIGGVQIHIELQAQKRRIDGPRIRLGHWYTLLEHVRFSPTQSGLVQLWLDGRPNRQRSFPNRRSSIRMAASGITTSLSATTGSRPPGMQRFSTTMSPKGQREAQFLGDPHQLNSPGNLTDERPPTGPAR